MHVWLQLVVACLSGAGYGLAAAPVGWSALGWVHLAPALVLLVRAPTWRRGALLGWATGVGVLASCYGWLAETVVRFGEVPWAAGVAALVLFVAVFAANWAMFGAVVAALRTRFGSGWVLVVGWVWVAVEYVVPALFPHLLGSVYYRNPWVWQIVAVFGPRALSALAVATNAALAEAWLRRREGRPLPLGVLAVVVGVWLANVGFGAWRHAEVEATLSAAPTARVGLVQRAEFPGPEARGPESLDAWLALSERLFEGRPAAAQPELVVWPESAVVLPLTSNRVWPALQEFTTRRGVGVVLGGLTRKRDPADRARRLSWNSVGLYGPDGRIHGVYSKRTLLAFGEYLPWGTGWVAPYVKGVSHLQPGENPVVFSAPSFRFTTPVCYEAIVARQLRELDDTDVIVNVTNDAWFGRTASPHQHAMLAAAAAVTLGRPLVRVAYTGASMVVEPHGDIVYETTPFTEVAEVVSLRLATVEAPYRTWGRLFEPVAVGVAALAVGAAWARKGGR